MEQKGIGSFGFLKVIVLQWNSHRCLLIYVRSKLKKTQNISNIEGWHQNTQNDKTFYHFDIYSRGKNKNLHRMIAIGLESFYEGPLWDEHLAKATTLEWFLQWSS